MFVILDLVRRIDSHDSLEKLFVSILGADANIHRHPGLNSPGNAFDMEKKGEGRILVRFTDIKDFHIHIIFATNKLIAANPNAVRGFVAGWLETIAFMRKNKAETVKIAMEVTNKDEDITSRSYDELMPMFSDTGRFDPKALETLKKSYVELNLLPTEPDMSQLYTEAFLPKK